MRGSLERLGKEEKSLLNLLRLSINVPGMEDLLSINKFFLAQVVDERVRWLSQLTQSCYFQFVLEALSYI